MSGRLIWIDLEMTGLNPDDDYIIEMATIVTNSNLEIIAEGPNIAIYQEEKILTNMDDWNTNQHTQSGLLERVRQSTVNEAAAETMTLAFLKKHLDTSESPMCGNTICQDRRFLFRHMPTLEKFFHYRNLDVSTLKILAQRWFPHLEAVHKKEATHLALADIRDSIEELRFYREHLFKQ